jgi:GTPase Era involved in 16S rRNA processing
MASPVFVVVGHVNRGKSSIVATLAADDSVRIDAMPGTTQHCREFPMRIGGTTLYTLIDTPGFERPRQVLGWLRERETTTAERRKTVEQFVAQHRSSDSFRQECELLQPILDGAAILYVVDGSKPPGPNYEAEMEILRWTAQPRVALINSTSEADYNGEWRPLLDQYFNMVRPFNAHQADFEQRVRLLQMLREMSDDTHAAIDGAIENLTDDRRRCFDDAAQAIAETLVAMLTLVVDKRLAADADPTEYREALAKSYYDQLRRQESECRRRLQDIFLHQRLEVEQDELAIVEEDLFNVDSWMRLGLTRGDLATAGAAAGALTGGVIDASVGGASFLIGTVVGGVTGGVASWLGAGKLPQVRIKGFRLGGKLLKIGPMTNSNFPYVVLDRACQFLDVVSHRAHARREQVEIDPTTRGGVSAALPAEQRKALEATFSKLRRRPAPPAVETHTADLVEQLRPVTEQCEQLRS